MSRNGLPPPHAMFEPARGALVTPEIADEAMALNPNITKVLISNAGHNIRRENFDGYLAAVRVFLPVK